MAMKPAPSKTPATVHASSKSQGSFGIQLGAFKSGADAANKRWSKLDQEYPKLLSGLSPTVSPKKGASGTLYRLQVANLSEMRANSICKTLKAASQACVLIHP
jgi:cell division septation protein DedD